MGRSRRRQRLNRRLPAGLLMVLLPSLVFAAEPASETLELIKEEETVQTATRTERPISQAPSNVYILTDEDIRHSGATDLPTLLRHIPGIEVMQTTGAEYNVSARGDNQLLANKMLVLVDGRSVYIDVQGFVFWKGLPITLPEIKRIEVVKGPIESLYGFNAFDGIIQIYTKSPEEMNGTTVQMGGGEWGTLTSAVIHAGKVGKLGYRLSFGEDQNQKWRDRDSLAFRAYRFNAHTEYALPGMAKLVVSGGLADMNKFDGPIVGLGNTILNSDVQLPYANVAYERRDLTVRAFWSGFFATALAEPHPLLVGFTRVTDRAGSSELAFDGNTYNLEAQHEVKLGASHRVTYGANYRHNTFSCNCTTAFAREDRLGFYLQDEWQLTSSLNVVAGFRYDLHTQIHSTLSPRLAVLYTVVPDHTLRATIAVAFRPPTLFETGEDLRAVTTGFPTVSLVGQNGLDPEQIVSYDLGYQGWFLRHRLRLRADLFLNHISDLIATSRPPSTTFMNINGQEADIYGGEAGGEYLVTRWLSGFANYSYQEVGQTFSDVFLRAVPRFKANVGVRGEWENGWNGEVVLHHYGAATYPIEQSFQERAATGAIEPVSSRVGSYNLLNLRVGYRFWHEKAEAAFTAFNALNDQHKEHPLGDTISSRVIGWLTLKF